MKYQIRFIVSPIFISYIFDIHLGSSLCLSRDIYFRLSPATSLPLVPTYIQLYCPKPLKSSIYIHLINSAIIIFFLSNQQQCGQHTKEIDYGGWPAPRNHMSMKQGYEVHINIYKISQNCTWTCFQFV